MPETVEFSKLMEEYDILVGGKGTVTIESLTADEETLLDNFIDNRISIMSKISPTLADIYDGSRDLIHRFAEIAKGTFKVPFGGESPTSGQFGVGDLIPQDIRYEATPSNTYPAYSDYQLNDWYISLTAGSPAYLLGSSDSFYKANPTLRYRFIGIILKNGIIEIGSTPEINQAYVRTEKVDYAWFRIHPLVTLPIEQGKALFQYNTPVAIPLWYDFGLRMAVLPVRTNPKAYLPLIGVIFFEYDYGATYKYVS